MSTPSAICSQCRAPADRGRIFCEKCGAELRPPVSLMSSHSQTDHNPSTLSAVSIADAAMQQEQPVSLAEGAGKFVFLLVGMLAGLFLFIVLGDEPFGVQFATLISYTAAVFCFVFFRWRWLPESYSLGDKQVRQLLPRLVVIHLVFLILLLSAVTEWIVLRPQLPNYWLTERGPKQESLYSDALILFCSLTFVTQVFISRRILKRSTTTEKERRTTFS